MSEQELTRHFCRLIQSWAWSKQSTRAEHVRSLGEVIHG